MACSQTFEIFSELLGIPVTVENLSSLTEALRVACLVRLGDLSSAACETGQKIVKFKNVTFETTEQQIKAIKACLSVLKDIDDTDVFYSYTPAKRPCNPECRCS